jgi:hypothetical protein
MQIKAALIDAVRNRQAVLFAGAGISWKAIGFGGYMFGTSLACRSSATTQSTTTTAAQSMMFVMSMSR